VEFQEPVVIPGRLPLKGPTVPLTWHWSPDDAERVIGKYPAADAVRSQEVRTLNVGTQYLYLSTERLLRIHVFLAEYAARSSSPECTFLPFFPVRFWLCLIGHA